MICQCCGTKDNKNGKGPVTVFTVEGLCRVCRVWFVGIGIARLAGKVFLVR